jgi:DNA polymerase I
MRLQRARRDTLDRRVRMDAALEQAKLSAHMLLPVHDELVFEVPNAEVAATIEVVRKEMVEAPHPYLQLRCSCGSTPRRRKIETRRIER